MRSIIHLQHGVFEPKVASYKMLPVLNPFLASTFLPLQYLRVQKEESLTCEEIRTHSEQ